MNSEQVENLDILQNIEFGLKQEYERNADLTDVKTIFALENAKIALKKQFGFSKNEKVVSDALTQGIIDWCVAIGLERINEIKDVNLKEFLRLIEKVKRSVKRHSQYGSRGYYNFVKDFV
jgi:hypothetical protein